MDRMLKKEIMLTVKAAVQQAMEATEERYLCAEELVKEFQMFTLDWLKNYGHLLPRERISVTNGTSTRCSRWAYPATKIRRMIASGDLREIQEKEQ